MADYYSLLARAVAALPQSTPEARRSVYERARIALLNQLRTIQPPVAEADIDAEGRALDEAIARLEAEAAGKAAPKPPPVAEPRKPALEPRPASPPRPAPPARPVPPPPPAPKTERPRAGPDSPKGGFSGAEPGRTESAGPFGEAAKSPPSGGDAKSPPSGEAAKSPPSSGDAKSPPSGGDAKSPPSREDAKSPAGAPAAPPRSEMDRMAASRKSFLDRKRVEAASWRESFKPGEPDRVSLDARAPDREEPSLREQQRPAAPLPPMPEAPGGSRRILAIAAILIVLVGVVALAAWQLRERPEDLAKLKPEETATESAAGGKFADRVEGDGAASPAGEGRVRADRTPAVPVAQKAELWVGSLQEPNKVDKIYAGTVVWRLDNVGGGPGEPVASAVRGDVDSPDAKLKMTLVIRKNVDPTLSASHTINVSFKIGAGSDLKNVKAIFPIQMRRVEAQSGEKIAGIPVPITENNFLIGLMRGDHEQRNVMLLRSLMVMDVPFQLVDGRAATINLEKGPSGERVFAEALDAWGQK